MRDAGASSYVSKERAKDAYKALGAEGGTYAGLTWNKARDVYNTYFEDEGYSRQYDAEYGEAHPEEEKKETHVLEAVKGIEPAQKPITKNPPEATTWDWYTQPSGTTAAGTNDFDAWTGASGRNYVTGQYVNQPQKSGVDIFMEVLNSKRTG